jgi:hypothetical protein
MGRLEGGLQRFCKSRVCANVQLVGRANQIIDFLESSPAWENLGATPATATLRANGGRLVIGGLKQQPNGHVVIVVKSAPLNYPVAYWGRLGAVGRKNTTINWSWNNTDRPMVHYFSLRT